MFNGGEISRAAEASQESRRKAIFSQTLDPRQKDQRPAVSRESSLQLASAFVNGGCVPGSWMSGHARRGLGFPGLSITRYLRIVQADLDAGDRSRYSPRYNMRSLLSRASKAGDWSSHWRQWLPCIGPCRDFTAGRPRPRASLTVCPATLRVPPTRHHPLDSWEWQVGKYTTLDSSLRQLGMSRDVDRQALAAHAKPDSDRQAPENRMRSAGTVTSMTWGTIDRLPVDSQLLVTVSVEGDRRHRT